MEKIQKLWMSPQHDALVDLIVSETDLTVEQAKKVIAFFERVEEAERDDIARVVYALVKDGNQVHNYPIEDVEVFRRYAVFDYVIKA